MYRIFFRLVLHRLDPERSHVLARASLRLLHASPLGRAMVRRIVGPTDPVLRTHALGASFASPVGVAAGVDKAASWFEQLIALGFGFVEVGTVTALAQEGNPRPRVARFPRDRALLNKMGFPNPGAASVAARLHDRKATRLDVPGQPELDTRRKQEPNGRSVIGVNVGKSRVTPISEAARDYRRAVRELATVADYLVLNVSSPNTPGLRDLQAVDALRPLIMEVRDELLAVGQDVPLLIKIGADLSDPELEAVARLALELELDGIVAVNTSADRSLLAGSDPRGVRFDGGGISGAPLKTKAVHALRCLRSASAGRLILISVGGIETADDVWERILAGATLVQVYTAFVYGGPAWPMRVNRSLARMMRETGTSSLHELVGKDVPLDRAGAVGQTPLADSS